MNEIMNEIEIQEREKPAAGESFYNICHSRTQLINEIVNEIEIHKWRKLAAGEFFYSIYVLLTALSERDFLDILSNLRGTLDQKSEGDFCTAVPCGLKSGGDASPATPPLDKPMLGSPTWAVQRATWTLPTIAQVWLRH